MTAPATRCSSPNCSKEAGSSFQIEKRYRRKDGQLIWVSNNVSLYQARRAIHIPDGIVEDISERKRLQGHLELERDRLRLLLDLTKNVLSHLDCCGFAARWLSASDGLCTAILPPRLARFRE